MIQHDIKHQKFLSFSMPTVTPTFTCPDRAASLIYSHLGADMQRDFWLLACGRLSCCYHSCGLGAGRYSAGAHSDGLVEIRPWNNSTKGSRGRADDGDSSASLRAQTHGNFGAHRHRPTGGVKKTNIHLYEIRNTRHKGALKKKKSFKNLS